MTGTNDAPLSDELGHVSRIADAVRNLMTLDHDMWNMNATAFTCSEADAIAELLAACGYPESAAVFLESHAAGDDGGDDHYVAPSTDS